MALDPIITFDKLNKSYKEFLDAQFTFRNCKIDSAAKDALKKECELFNGPFIEAHMPYEGKHSLEDLVEEGVLNRNISKAFTHKEYSVYKRYNHQEKSIRMVGSGKSIIVASGTGSGKTECFFIPIINDILNEISQGTICPGVRALIIYPMNALANDQMERLRESLKSIPEITFGRYIGETPPGDRLNIAKGRQSIIDKRKKDNGETTLPNELLTRAEIEKAPPHILITNYAMLEYMLLRADSQKIFNGNYSKYFKFLVLDEAHTYKGAHGTEVAMLIRRLKETIFGKIEDCLTCIGTSATLGGGEDELQKVVDFASDLFCEKFTLDSIISSDRKKLQVVNGECKVPSYYLNLFDKYKNYFEEDKSKILYNELSNDRLVYEIRKRILERTITISELADSLHHDLNIEKECLEEAIARIIEMSGEAISPTDGHPLINAKYHVFARTLEGGFITFGNKIRVFTERRKEFEGHRVYELYNCMKCGQEYISGKIETQTDGNDYLMPEEDESKLFMLSNSTSKITIDEDDSEDSKDDAIDLMAEDKHLMCPKCGRIFPDKCSEHINCCGYSKDKFVCLIEVKSNKKNTCYKCGKFNKGTIRRLTTSEDSAIEVITRKLYQLLPEEEKQNKVVEIDDIWGETLAEEDLPKGRKLLVFSDNRQEAARFAIFIQNRYNDWLWKKIIYNEIQNMQEDSISFKRLSERCFREADKNQLFYNEKTTEDKQDFAKKQILKEVIELEPRMSLNRLGLIEIKIDSLDKIGDKIIDDFSNGFNINREEFLKIVEFLFDSLRRQGCVTFPDGVDQTEDVFEPRNYETYFKKQGGEKLFNKQFFGFIPSLLKTNKRHNFLKKFFESKGLNEYDATNKADEFLNKFSKSFDSPYFTEVLPIMDKITLKEGVFYKLNLNNIIFKRRTDQIFVCEQCGETITTNLGICGKTNCDGHLVLITDNEDRGQYYRDSFTKIEMIPMNAKEHTAQISSQTATDYQDKFKENDINILSCSTTFEMGVDIGSLESVVLRNVPPETSNYIQRAGRAGRRGSSAAFILTFAKRRSHDLSYYADPRKMINGIIKSPYIELNNAYLIRRHIHSIIFSYLSKKGYILSTAKDLLGNDLLPQINKTVLDLIQKKPEDLFKSIDTVVPNSVKEELGVDKNWSFGQHLVSDDANNERASLDNAVNNLFDTIKYLTTTQEEYYKDKKGAEGDRLKKVIETYQNKDYISYLAETNVLPRYGFPVYTVPLELNTDNILKGSLELQRDLRMAITEYAPGTQVVANGKYWKPYALKRESNRGWPTYDFAVCDKCSKKYFYKTAFAVSAINRLEMCCNCKLNYRQLVIPQFGFTTRRSDKESRKLREETHYHSTLMFEGFLNDKQIEEEVYYIGGKEIYSKYSPNGEMFAINGGKNVRRENLTGIPFTICEKCGFVNTPDIHVKKGVEHASSFGRKCNGQMFQAYLGHYFKSDALVITLPINPELNINNESILFAIIEGASKFMEIDRREIGGAIWSNTDMVGINITLFDTVPNGAGHVKRMQPYIKEILESARQKVDGTCGCGEETCCYGCLRNYDNQIYHDSMSRGDAKRYLNWLINE